MIELRFGGGIWMTWRGEVATLGTRRKGGEEVPNVVPVDGERVPFDQGVP